MSSPKHPKSTMLPKLKDPNNVEETFINHVVGLGVRDGFAHVTLSIIRPNHSSQNGGSEDENVVGCRLTMPLQTLSALVEADRQLKAVMQMQSATTSKPN